MQTINQLTNEAAVLIDKMLAAPKEDDSLSFYGALVMSVSRHASVIGVLEQALYDAFKQLPVAEVQKVLDKMKKV